MAIGPQDFPPNFLQTMQHPDDYQPQSSPITPEYILHRNGIHSRLIFRISFYSSSIDKYIPMSFIVDTGAPAPFYFGSVALSCLQAHGLLHEDEDGNDFLSIQQRKINYSCTPSAFQPVNIIGLRFVSRVGMSIDATSFKFIDVPEHF
jgi:hypothetical protein